MEKQERSSRADIPYDFCAIQDKSLIEDSLWSSAQKMQDYDKKLELVYMAQLMTPEFITGEDRDDYLLIKSTFDSFLFSLETHYEARQQQFEEFNDELVKSASTRVARQVKLAIEIYRQDEAKRELGFKNLASELFVLEMKQPVRPDNDNIPF